MVFLGIFRLMRKLRVDRVLRSYGPARPFTDVFKGFEKVEAIRKIFGDNADEILRQVKVEFTWFGGYMWVNGMNGHLMISSRYLNSGDRLDVYLDLIHELVHVRQYMQGKELFDEHYGYVNRPTEIEAYKFAVDEARRLGILESRICYYLKTEWMSEQDLKQLASHFGLKCA